MKALGTALYLATALGWTALGALGLSGEMPAYALHAWLALGVGGAMLALLGVQWTYRRAGERWPDRVIEIRDKVAVLAYEERCVECGACQLNCHDEAIFVTKGTGCLVAIIRDDILKLPPREAASA